MRTQEDYLNELLTATNTLSEFQAKLSPFMGGQVANLLARLTHPRQAYRFFLHSGGFGCTTWFLLNPLMQLLFMAGVLTWVSFQGGLGTRIEGVFDVQTIGSVEWLRGVALLTGLCGAVLFIFVQGLTFCALFRGTILRGLRREHIQGPVNLEGTGKSNIILTLMGRGPDTSKPFEQ